MKRRWKFPWQASQTVFTCSADTPTSPGWSRAAPLLLADVARSRTTQNTTATPNRFSLCLCVVCAAEIVAHVERECVCVCEKQRERFGALKIKRKIKKVVRSSHNKHSKSAWGLAGWHFLPHTYYLQVQWVKFGFIHVINWINYYSYSFNVVKMLTFCS